MNISYLFSLPLLTKELIEQAQHKRTYILRVIYAVVLYGLALFQYNSMTGGSVTGFANMGVGRDFFLQLVMIQTWAIMFILPAISCGALTVEKEKDTLALLLLTKLSPWTIVFEKFLSRVFAMGTYQLLSLPLFGIVQSMGGVELSETLVAIAGLMLLTIAVGSVSILFSTWFRTTAEAFILAYLAGFFLTSIFSQFFTAIFLYSDLSITSTMSEMPFMIRMVEQTGEMPLIVGISVLSVFFSALMLIISAKVLVKRAFIQSWNVLLFLFQRADRFFNELNTKTTGGIVLVRDRELLPLFQPISWRETRKKSLGTFRYQFRVLMLLLTPLILVIAAVLSDARFEFTTSFHAFPVFFWLISVICLTIHSTGVIAAERIRQTLDVLLVTPLTAKEIVTEKLAGVRRLIKVLSIPFAVLILFQAIWTGYIHQGTSLSQSVNLWSELTAASLSVFIYMPVIMWVGFQFGLKTRTQIQAVLWTLSTITAACLIPPYVAAALNAVAANSIYVPEQFRELPLALGWLSPLAAIFPADAAPQHQNSMQQTTPPQPLDLTAWILVVNFITYGIVWHFLRRNAIRTFSAKVRRLESDGDSDTVDSKAMAIA